MLPPPGSEKPPTLTPLTPPVHHIYSLIQWGVALWLGLPAVAEQRGGRQAASTAGFLLAQPQQEAAQRETEEGCTKTACQGKDLLRSCSSPSPPLYCACTWEVGEELTADVIRPSRKGGQATCGFLIIGLYK